MKFRGRPILGAIFGFLFFFFLAMDLLFFGVIPLKSPLITVLPVVGIFIGLLWAYAAPLGGRKAAAQPAPAMAGTAAPPMAAPPPAAEAPPPPAPPPPPEPEPPAAPTGTTQF